MLGSRLTLKRHCSPLQHIPKPKVYEMARGFELPTATREESMGICFVGERRRFSEFLGKLHFYSPKIANGLNPACTANYIPPNPGSNNRRAHWSSSGHTSRSLAFHHWAKCTNSWHERKDFRVREGYKCECPLRCSQIVSTPRSLISFSLP